MAIWMTALKIIPWGDVLESAPHIVKAAKHLFTATKTDASSFAETPDSSAGKGPAHLLDQRIRLLETRIVELGNEQKSSTELIKSLAEQNALVVEAIEVFRVRVKILLVACILLVGVLAGLVFWLAMGR
ncbi:MAG: hypothetical protein L0H15_11335 [Nitrosospira sp.]|nr:hypothetical protein [Nitrosospira sp.]MDN5882265.1 hypothetical protein [Nitrosospira sp.]MDN5934872.1 hypothetical protein [Nitrosospira sp.]